MKKQHTYLLLIISLIFYFTSMLIFKFDVNYTYRWLTLCLSLLPLLIILAVFIFSLVPHKKILATINLYGFHAIFLFSIISRLIFLADYPFVSVGDEVRDGGLNAMEISTGVIKCVWKI